ncbi:glycosyltransferase family 4 protein [Oricola sp.]|uniref:glycosyltransferase family 4 protein n=1 Tax=Oricola sp. TaxID=1979950 RepID=UPI003BAC80A0
MAKTIAVVLKGYPRLSETFIAQELLALENHGYSLRLISLRHPTDKHRHPIHDEIVAPVTYLPEYLHREPGRVFRAWRAMRKAAHYRETLRSFWADLKRDFTPNRVRRFGQALVLAHELPGDVGWLYSHFIHTPAAVTKYASILTGLSWSCSAHAKDIWTTPDWELAEKLEATEWTVTCTASGFAKLQSLAPAPDRVQLVYHGLDLSRFPPDPHADARAARREPPLRIISVGRAVEKKGFDTLLDAFALLGDDVDWQWIHIGGGTLLNDLKAQSKSLGLDARVSFLGALPQETVLQRYRESDLFVLPCRIAADGDRDGLPNVLVEAQSQRLACISTNISAIPELIEHGVNGLMVEPNDPAALAEAIRLLAEDPDLRAQMAQAGETKVREKFDHLRTNEKLTDLFEETAWHPETAEQEKGLAAE